MARSQSRPARTNRAKLHEGPLAPQEYHHTSDLLQYELGGVYKSGLPSGSRDAGKVLIRPRAEAAPLARRSEKTCVFTSLCLQASQLPIDDPREQDLAVAGEKRSGEPRGEGERRRGGGGVSEVVIFQRDHTACIIKLGRWRTEVPHPQP